MKKLNFNEFRSTCVVLDRNTTSFLKGGNQICCVKGGGCTDCGPGGSCDFSDINASGEPGCQLDSSRGRMHVALL